MEVPEEILKKAKEYSDYSANNLSKLIRIKSLSGEEKDVVNEVKSMMVEAGIDAFVMPSRYEPCGLNQMYSQRYGTLPIVSPVGGLYDTVVNADMPAMKQKRATGFVMDTVSATGLYKSFLNPHFSNADQSLWTQMQKTAMQQDFSWKRSAEAYLQLYQQAIQDSQVSQAPSIKPAIKAGTKT